MQTKGLITSVTGWFARPFNPQGSALDWVLFLGLVIMAAWLWNTVIMLVAER